MLQCSGFLLKVTLFSCRKQVELSMNSDTFELVRASRALGISATYVSQAEEAAKSFENRVKHLIQQVVPSKAYQL